MARRVRFVRIVHGGGEGHGRYERLRRNRKATAWLVVGTFFCAAVAGFLIERQDGAALALLDETSEMDGRLATTVLETGALERDALGRVSFEGWGARRPRLVPVALQSEISLLREHRDRVRDRRWLDLPRRSFPDLPIADDAPPRMDSGHPDPDRLLPSSRPVTEDAR